MLKADAQDLKTIFEKQRRHKIPLYQRRYVWEQESQWEPLWEDIETISERYLEDEIPQPHFLGAVVLKQDETPSREIETRLVIDGQQRLTTLQLLLAAAHDVYTSLENRFDAQKKTLQFLVENQVGIEEEEEKYKVWPTQADQNEYIKVITAGSPHEVQKRVPNGDSRLRDAYIFFYDKIDGWLKRNGSDGLTRKVDALQKTLVRGLMVVVIDLSLEDDAQVIFESLNARGTPLLQSELVKNYLLHLSEIKGGPTERLHDDYWSPFETNRFWSQEVKQGRLYRQRIEIFLQHFLTMEMSSEITALKLFDEFKRFVKSRPDDQPEDFLSAIRHFGDIFEAFYAEHEDKTVGKFFYRINTMEVSTVLPLLLFLFDKLSAKEDIAELKEALLHIESFLVRRMVCGLTTKQYNKLFLEALQEIEKTDSGIVQTLENFLFERTADSELWPNDDLFMKEWLSNPLYRRITRSRLRMILEALEDDLRTPKTEPVDIPKGLTVEHIMPRAWREHWPLSDPNPEAEEERETLIHTIGNLTLLTQSLNPALRNSAWETKKVEIAKHSILRLNKYFDDAEVWTDDHILERGSILFEQARSIWKYPEIKTSTSN